MHNEAARKFEVLRDTDEPGRLSEAPAKSPEGEIKDLRAMNEYQGILIANLKNLVRYQAKVEGEAAIDYQMETAQCQAGSRTIDNKEREIRRLTQQLGTRDEQVAKLTKDYQGVIERLVELKARLLKYEKPKANTPVRKKPLPKF